MKVFEREYEDLLTYASKMAARHRLYNFTGEDIAHGVYEEYFNSGKLKSATKEDFKKSIISLIYFLLADNLKGKGYNDNKNNCDSFHPDTIQCKKCLEPLPCQLFNIEIKGRGHTYHKSTCKDCQSKYDKQRRLLNPLATSKPSDYYKGYRNALPDSYIKDILKKKGFTTITKKMVQEKRIALYQKRQRLCKIKIAE